MVRRMGRGAKPARAAGFQQKENGGSSVKEFLVIVGAIVTAQIVLDLLGMLFHWAGTRAGRLITNAIPKPEPTVEPKPDGFATWLQRPRQ
jgi:hypothetical protein